MFRRLLLLLLIFISVPLWAQNSNALPAFEVADCPFPLPAGETEGETLDCGYLLVPENRSDSNSPIIELAVAILYSDDPEPDPVIYLEGGPGGSALVAVEDWVASPLRERRDLILIDQRGTGYSEPALDCEDYEDTEDCYEALLAEGINLSAYNSAENAADIADLRIALDLDEVNLYGISYGTRLALTVMRDHPAGIRSVVLDSAYPPQVAGVDEQALHGTRAIELLFEACARDLACVEAYGDLDDLFFAVVDDLNDFPVTVYMEEYDEDVEVDGYTIINQLYDTLYITDAIPTLPYAIHLLSYGDYLFGLEVLGGAWTLEDLELNEAGEDWPEEDFIEVPEGTFIPDGDAEGMYNSVECFEEVHFNTLAGAEDLSAGIPDQLYETFLADIEAQLTECEIWDSGQSAALENQPVVSDIPTLVLAGSFDPVTPPAWGQAAAEHLRNSYYVEFPHAGHGLLDAGDCAVSIGLQFLDDPDLEPDTACVGEIELEFYVPEDCVLAAFQETELLAEPDYSAEAVDALDEGDEIYAEALYDDGEIYWFLTEDENWVSEEEVDFEDHCLYVLPLMEE